MNRRAIGTTLVLSLAMAGCTQDTSREPAQTRATPSASPTQAAPGRFVVVGHDPLFARGMNAGLALHGRYAYVGNRTDASPGHPHPGVLVVDLLDRAKPHVVGEIEPPPAGTSTRELRVWHEQDVLVVLNLRCGGSTHACSGAGTPSIRFYDLSGARARDPMLLTEFVPPFAAHEMYLWADLERRGRALLFVSTDTAGVDQTGLFVLDISGAREGEISEVARWSGNRLLGGSLHSVGVSSDGMRAYLAHLGGGFAVLDTSDLAQAVPSPAMHLVTEPESAPRWAPGPHSAIEVPGTSLVFTTDEVYGGAASCPWGWARMIDVSNPRRPRVAGELREERNHPRSCADVPRATGYSFSSHNPTIAGGIAFTSWHGSGLIAAAIEGNRLIRTAGFVPVPLARVATEDPRLTSGPVKVAMWSTPVVSGGLVYVVDLRNGLYVLRYEGPGGARVARIAFREGNSNLSG